MKNLYAILLLILLPAAALAQTSTVKIYAIDAMDNRDSVMIGHDYLSTVGLDPAMGETNLFGTTANPVLDMRVIQRTQANFLCLPHDPFFSTPASPPLYFQNNLDQKLDIRPINRFQADSRNFQIQVQAQHYPVIISMKSVASPLQWMFGFSLVYSLDSACAVSPYRGAFFSSLNLDTLASPSEHSMVLYFDHEVGRPDFTETNPWQLLQNPVTDVLSLQLQQPETGELHVLDALGRTVATYPLQQQETEYFTVSQLPAGLYYLRLHTAQNLGSTVRKMLKQ